MTPFPLLAREWPVALDAAQQNETTPARAAATNFNPRYRLE